MTNPRSADDFDTIRARLEQIKKEREAAQNATPEQPSLPLAQVEEESYDCSNNLSVTEKMQLELSEAPIGFAQAMHNLIQSEIILGEHTLIQSGFEDEDLILITDEENSQWVRRMQEHNPNCLFAGPIHLNTSYLGCMCSTSILYRVLPGL